MGCIGVLSWPTEHFQAAFCDPIAGGIEEGGGHVEILDSLEETEEADLCMMVVVEPVVDGGGDAAQQIVALPRQEVGDLRMLMVGMMRCQ